MLMVTVMESSVKVSGLPSPSTLSCTQMNTL